MFSSFSGSFKAGRRAGAVVAGTTIRALLSASGKTAWDAATDGNFFSVTAADYAAVASGLTNVTKVGMTDAQVAENGSLWSGGYAQAMPTTLGTLAANSYIFGFVTRSQTSGTATLLSSTTHKGTYTAVGNSPTTSAGGARSYFIRKTPVSSGAATTYLGILQNTSALMGTTSFANAGGYDNTSPYSTWTNWTGTFIIFQVLSTSTVQW